VNNYGHSNWGYLDTYTKEELKRADHGLIENQYLTFWHEDHEVMRSENYYKKYGWSNGFVEEFYDKPDDPYAELRLEFGRDEEGHQEKFYETKTYESAEEFYKDYDYYFKKQASEQ
jgi:hypothetical protein